MAKEGFVLPAFSHMKKVVYFMPARKYGKENHRMAETKAKPQQTKNA